MTKNTQPAMPGFQPAEREFSLLDILESSVKPAYFVSKSSVERLLKQTEKKIFSRCAFPGAVALHSKDWEAQLFVIRKLTPLECERAMGFPDLWTEGFFDSVRWDMLGNAVVPQISEFIGKTILEVMEKLE